MRSLSAAVLIVGAWLTSAARCSTLRLNEAQVRNAVRHLRQLSDGKSTVFLRGRKPCSSTVVFAQVVGTHNSYHQAPPQAIQDLAWNPLVAAVAASYAQSAVNTTQYNHLDLYQQLEIGQYLVVLHAKHWLCMLDHSATDLAIILVGCLGFCILFHSTLTCQKIENCCAGMLFNRQASACMQASGVSRLTYIQIHLVVYMISPLLCGWLVLMAG